MCILLVCEVFFDFDMLLLVYLKLVDGLYIFLFELVEGGVIWGCYLIIGLLVKWVYCLCGYELEVEDVGEVIEYCYLDDLLVEIEKFC